VTNAVNVGVAPAAICVVTVDPIGEIQAAVAGSVSHSVTFTGRFTPPVSGDTVMRPATPTFTVATPNTPVPVLPGMFTIPVLPMVAPSATMSGTGVFDADRSSALSPRSFSTRAVFSPPKLKPRSVGAKAPVGVIAIT
jgi:hypothetical protein